MTTKTRQILEESFARPPLERAAIVEGLLASLDRPDPQIDALWAAEAEARLTAYEAGQVKAVSAEDVFADCGCSAFAPRTGTLERQSIRPALKCRF